MFYNKPKGLLGSLKRLRFQRQTLYTRLLQPDACYWKGIPVIQRQGSQRDYADHSGLGLSQLGLCPISWCRSACISHSRFQHGLSLAPPTFPGMANLNSSSHVLRIPSRCCGRILSRFFWDPTLPAYDPDSSTPVQQARDPDRNTAMEH